jgi:hypothetical protein
MPRIRAYALLVGARNGAANGRRFSAVDDARLRGITREFFPSGFTVLRAIGGWWDGTAHKFVREESRQILVSATDERHVCRWARRLGRALNQKSLFVIRQGEALTIKI